MPTVHNLADGTNLIPPSAPLLYKDFATDLAAAHLRWIFTVADKLPNTFNSYLQILLCLSDYSRHIRTQPHYQSTRIYPYP